MAKTQAEFQQYLTNLKQEAIAKGYDTQLIEQAFATASYKEKVISADKNQPEVKETLETYLPKRVPEGMRCPGRRRRNRSWCCCRT